jgi:hypothetical protein
MQAPKQASSFPRYVDRLISDADSGRPLENRMPFCTFSRSVLQVAKAGLRARSCPGEDIFSGTHKKYYKFTKSTVKDIAKVVAPSALWEALVSPEGSARRSKCDMQERVFWHSRFERHTSDFSLWPD